ncbi:MAG: DUF2125 domain-containing protein [Pseudomonadota bacterium]
MPRFSCLLSASSTIAILATGAVADLSAEDVWEDWKTYTTGFGYDVTGTEARSGDTLTVTGVTMRASAEAEEAFEVEIGQIVLQEQSDGSVTIDLPSVIPMQMSAGDESFGTTKISMDYRQEGGDIVASGTSDAINYTYAFDTISVETTGMEINGEAVPPESNSVNVSVNALQGTSQTTLDSLRRYVQALEAESVSYTFVASDEETSSTSRVSGQLQDVGFNGTGSMPLRDIDSSDMDAMLAAGFAADGTFTFGANALTLSVESPEGPVEGSVVSGDSTISVGMSQDGLKYDILQNAVQVDMTSAQFPAPVNFNIARSTFNFLLPVSPSDTMSDYAFGFAMEGFEASEAIWSMFDPQAQLPRDPATIALDLTGRASLLLDVFDPAAMAGMTPTDSPAKIESLNINSLKVSALGADLSGTGNFTFNNDTGLFPQPVGAVDLSLTGGNALIDKLIGAGLLPEDQAMGMRMMMGLLAVPGSAPDTLTSKIEINAQGHVMANGQRIQ